MARPPRSLGCILDYQASGPSTFVFAVRPSDDPAARQAILRESLSLSTGEAGEEWRSVDGIRWLRVLAPAGPLQLRYEAEVQGEPVVHDPAGITELPVQQVPQTALHFLLPSRYCESDRLTGFAQAQFGGLAQGHSRVAAICDFIYQRTAYQRGSTDVRTTALDVLTDAAVREAMREYTAEATTIIVAQRVSSIVDADQILVLDAGRIVDRGTHEELLGRCAVYQEIVDSQETAGVAGGEN